MKNKILLMLVVFTFVFGLAISQKAQADSVTGWLWGGSEETADGTINGNETGVGWISANNTNPGAGGSVSYGFDIPLSGNVTGYAWSENIGYLNFQPTADLAKYPGCGFPTAPCNTVQRSGSDLKGWARFEEIRLAGANAGGWEGWVRMKNVAIAANGTDLTGFAWNGEEDVAGVKKGLGWIDFSKAKIAVTNELRICSEACTASALELTTLNMTIGESSRQVYACEAPASSSDCVGTNRTSDANWSVAGSSITNPMTSKGVVNPISTGTSTVTATYGSLPSANLDVTVSRNCYSCNTTTYNCDRVARITDCLAGEYSTSAECLANCSAPSTPGYWKEVAP